MADAIVSFAVQRLADLLISETKLLYGVRDQINEIQRELKRMQNFLIEADKKQIQDERVRGWVDEIKELAFRTEDAIEIFALQGATNSRFKEALRRFACISSQLISRHKVVTEMNDIKAKLANIHQSLTTYGITKGLEEGETSNSQVNFKTRRISLPYDVEKDFIGMEKEIEELVSSLKKEDAGSVCKIPGLTEDEGWQLLSRKAWIYGQPEVYDDTRFSGRLTQLRLVNTEIEVDPMTLLGLRGWRVANSLPFKTSLPFPGQESLERAKLSSNRIL
ncbi:hypothetical protein POM88_053417 [Heracleum sosnowskyi]|uniref:Disease resistance N-terminal domain-containing protein n=1 Tax=Heracleum sosnowskyi TaxID=360622 RepID=A0AAD8GQ08_9APIA|nr:hypothetical protein POM88_053417 [Heracleum sosnowskyi]